jgi:hypothetical protein
VEGVLSDARTIEDAEEQIERLNARVVELLREKEAADQACQRLCGKHGYATGHGDTIADMIDEISAQIYENSKP